jgi:DNA-binding NtrC family response regulator
MSQHRVLIIDDNEMIREALSEMLSQAGYSILEAEDGKSAIQLTSLEPVDLIITDLFMPEIDGLEVIQHVRRQHPRVKIIAMSGGGSRGLVELLSVAQKMGAHKIFMKPFEWDEILGAIEELLAE